MIAHTTFQTAADENLLMPYRPSWAHKVPDCARDAQDRWYGTYETSIGICCDGKATNGCVIGTLRFVAAASDHLNLSSPGTTHRLRKGIFGR